MRALRTGFYILPGALTIAVSRLQLFAEEPHAREVIIACTAYRAVHGAVPG